QEKQRNRHGARKAPVTAMVRRWRRRRALRKHGRLKGRQIIARAPGRPPTLTLLHDLIDGDVHAGRSWLDGCTLARKVARLRNGVATLRDARLDDDGARLGELSAGRHAHGVIKP